MQDQPENCAFCGKHKDQVQKLIVSGEVSICNECVVLCQELLEDNPPPGQYDQERGDPRHLKKFLDQYVVGQDHAKMVLAVAVVNHYKRFQRTDRDPEIDKANILMLGPTGSGKTLLARTIARYLDVPFAIADATTITEAGYVGDDVETLISRLYSAANHDIDRARRGIVFIDEIDKIARKGESSSLTRDVSGEGVQQALLKIVEGTLCRIAPQSSRKHPGADTVEIDTRDILFLAGGAFVGLEAVINQRVNGSGMGFASPLASPCAVNLASVTPDDLVRFGMIPELVGRFPTVMSLDSLTRENLVHIMTETKNNLMQQYQWIFAQDGVELVFESDALMAIVDRALTSNTGARALHQEMERCLMPHMFSLRDYQVRDIKQLKVTVDQVNNPATL